MERYIAFLRGINVGGHRVKMTDLRILFEELCFANTETFIASGNVLFEASITDRKHLKSQIENRLYVALGYNVPTFIRSFEEITAIAAYNPFPQDTENNDAHTISILFMEETATNTLQDELIAFRTPLDDFHVRDKEIYWLCRGKTTD